MAGMHTHMHAQTSQDSFQELFFFLPSREAQGSNAGPQAWWPVSLPTEPGAGLWGKLYEVMRMHAFKSYIPTLWDIPALWVSWRERDTT